MRRNSDDLIKTYLDYTSNHEATVKVHKWAFISVIAAALERRVFIDRGYYTLFPNLYTFIIGRSGLIKKSTSTGIAVNLLREVKGDGIRKDGPSIMSERLTAASLIDQLRLSGRTFKLGDRRITQSAVFCYASELSVFLEEVFGSITSLLTTFYDCVPYDSSKPWVYSTKKSGEVKIFGPCLNMLGASTKAWLTKCIPKSEMEGGFTSRIVFVVENNIPDRLQAWPVITQEMELIKYQIIEDLNAIYHLAGEFQIEEQTKDLFTRWYTHHMKNVVPINQDPRMVGYMARKGDLMLKIAMVRSVSRSNDLVLKMEDLKWAQRELEALEIDWRMAFDGMTRSRNKSLPQDINSFVKSRIKVTLREIADAFAKQFPPTDIQHALDDLLGMGEIEEIEESFNGKKVKFYTFPGADITLS